MRTLPAAGFALLALGLAFNAGAATLANADFNFDTTEDLVQVCSTTTADAENVPASVACRAFIEATMQYHDGISKQKKMKRLVCPPPTVTVGDAQAALLDWAKANAGNAKLMGEQPVVGVLRALGAKYPCR